MRDPGAAAGFYLFNLITAAVYGGLTVLVLYRHAREAGVPAVSFTPSGIVRTFALLLIALAVVGGARENGLKGLAAMTEGISAFSLTETVYTPAGRSEIAQDSGFGDIARGDCAGSRRSVCVLGLRQPAQKGGRSHPYAQPDPTEHVRSQRSAQNHR